jgi:hypothetical protein
MNRHLAALSLVCAVAASSAFAHAEEPSAPSAAVAQPELGEAASKDRASPFQLALWNPVQTADETRSIHGLRLNFPYGVNRDVYGLDFGIASHTTRNVYGVQYGLGGVVDGEFRGPQLNAFVSITRGELKGWQQAAYDSAGTLKGAQTGFVNYVELSGQGAQFGLVNLTGGQFEGVSLGVVNHARRVDGLQLGVVNIADELHGVQIGLANFAKNGFAPFFPVVNVAL